MHLRKAPLAIAVGAICGACDWATKLESDPAAWSPPRATRAEVPEDGPSVDAASPADAPHVECQAEPAFDPSLRTSRGGAGSHRAGEPCLEACHVSGGSARLVFAAAGTVYRSQTSRAVASGGGAVHGIGGSRIDLDACGNFYAVAEALAAGPNATQPFVQNPTFHRMDKALFREPSPGDCNQADCHDFSSRTRWGIYF
jgi:hypothetical protein